MYKTKFKEYQRTINTSMTIVVIQLSFFKEITLRISSNSKCRLENNLTGNVQFPIDDMYFIFDKMCRLCSVLVYQIKIIF